MVRDLFLYRMSAELSIGRVLLFERVSVPFYSNKILSGKNKKSI